jgi:hypothetical protein
MTPTKLAPRLASGAALFGLLALAGCGGGTGELTGTVKSGAKIVASGSVTAVGSDGIPHGAVIGPDGRYTLAGLPLGEVKLLVSSPNPAAQGKGPGGGPGGRNKEGRGKEGRQPPPTEQPPEADPEIAKKWFRISDDYGDLAKTSLRATVKAGRTEHDIDVK